MRWFDRVKYVFGIKPNMLLEMPVVLREAFDELKESQQALDITIDVLTRDLAEEKQNCEFQRAQATDGFRQFREAKEELKALQTRYDELKNKTGG